MAKIVDLRKEYDKQINNIVHEVVHAMDGLKRYHDYHDIRSDEDGNMIESYYVGTLFNIMPSGKYYMPWTSNQTWSDIVKDTYFSEKLEEKLDDLSMWLESGEGCSTDLFVCRHRSDLNKKGEI